MERGRAVLDNRPLEKSSAAPGTNGAVRILVVEDNPANQLLAIAVLELGGFVVDVAESAYAALRRIGNRKPDLILMDIELAGEDGLSLTRRLKAEAATTSIPVVALTAHAMGGFKQQALA